MTTYEVPLSPRPQRVRVQVGDRTYRLRLYWVKAEEGGWWLDVLADDGAPLACGLPLTPGVDLLEGLGYLNVGPGARMWCYTDGVPWLPPAFDNLGVTSHLVFSVGA